VGKLVTVDGDPGLGKSTLATAIGATVTVGGRWPDGTRCDYPGDVLLMSAEDGLADTIRPRYDAAGADIDRVHALEGVTHIDEEGEPSLRPPTLSDVATLESIIKAKRVRLLVVDVVMAYLPTGTDSHKDQDIRRVLSRLAALADRTTARCCCCDTSIRRKAVTLCIAEAGLSASWELLEPAFSSLRIQRILSGGFWRR
jgi:RecA-family ATPase